MAEYLDYQEYVARGGKAGADEFEIFALRAKAEIDAATQKRVEAMKTVPPSVKLCMTLLIEKIRGWDDIDAKAVASESASAGAVSHSVSYITTTDDDKSQAVKNILNVCLAWVCDDRGTPLLYKGAMA